MVDLIPGILAGKKIALHSPATEVFDKTTQIKAFYAELHAFLVKHRFKDTHSPGGHAKKGELVDAKVLNRTGDMFETYFCIIDSGWAKEIELKWEAVVNLPTSSYGNAYFSLDLVCRNMQDKEILDGNNKKVMQKGKWEFRNKISYENTIVKDFIDNIPIIKNSKTLKEIYLRNMYEKKIEEEVVFVMSKVKAGIYGIIYKYFR